MKKRFFSSFALSAMLFTSAWGAEYGLPSGIQEGNILHCFDWTFNDIKTELPSIAAAGFGSVQVSPVQGNCATNAEWFFAYMPYDFKFRANGNGSRAQLQSLCAEAEKYGIKVIVDVVANHVNQASGAGKAAATTATAIQSPTASSATTVMSIPRTARFRPAPRLSSKTSKA